MHVRITMMIVEMISSCDLCTTLGAGRMRRVQEMHAAEMGCWGARSRCCATRAAVFINVGKYKHLHGHDRSETLGSTCQGCRSVGVRCSLHMLCGQA